MNPITVETGWRGRARPVGTLVVQRTRGNTRVGFGYRPEWLRDGYALEPGLPLHSGTQFPDGELFGCFQDSCPDRWGRTLIRRAEAMAAREGDRPARTLTDVDYLLGVSDLLRQGGLRLRDAGDRYLSPDSEVPPLAQLPHLLALSRRVEDEAATLTELRNLLRAGSSLGGARPKANIRDGRSFKIAKFTSNMDTTSVVAWEYVCLDMAAAAGISVPGRRLVMVAGKPVLLLDRFDRTADGGRVGFISAMTVLRRRDGGSATYEELAYELETFIPSDVAAQKRELFKRIAFGLAVNNTDDHLRNHGFLRGDHHWRLSPMYDVTPSRDSVVHATPVDDADDGHNSVQCLTDLAELFDLSRGDVASIFEEILRATAGWRRRAAAAGMDGKEIEAHAPCFDSPLRSALAAAAG